MRYFYHGTSAESALSILKNGFGGTDTVWTVSDPNSVYLHPEESECRSGVSEALYSAITAAAVQGSQKDHVVIFEIALADEDVDEYVTADCSVEYAGDSFEVNVNDLNNLLKQGRAYLAAAKVPGYEPMYRSFYLCSCVNMYSNIPEDVRLTVMRVARTCGDIACFATDNMPGISERFADLEPFSLETANNSEDKTSIFNKPQEV